MYQNSPAHYNQGYASPSPQQYGGGGYYGNNDNMQQHPPPYGGNPGMYGAPSPVNAAYQRANAAMAGMPGGGRGVSPSPPNNNQAGGGASGLIRLTLRKPMGIVFEPMTDPHNPSQQRGVRICDLPRTGAAAMSQKLEVGDELLSINDKTMSRLTFDEIMDFIIEADKERVDLLFRRPDKDKLKGDTVIATPGSANAPPGQPLSPMGLGGLGSNSNSVKWIDEKSDVGGSKPTEDAREPEPRDDRRGGRNSGRANGKATRQDEPSVDDTYNDGYTVESQSQYTMETYEDDRRRGGRGGREADSRYSEDESARDRHDRKGRGGNDRHDKRKSSDPVESSGFLDLLIDTLCTSVMGRDARDMCGDRSGNNDKKAGGHQTAKKGYDDGDEFTVDDEGTYATYEDQVNDHRGGNDHRDHRHGDPRNDRHHHHHHHQKEMTEEESLATMEEETFQTEDDGTQTLESKDVVNKKQQQQQPQQPHPITDHLHMMSQSSGEKKSNKEQVLKSSSKSASRSKDQADPIMNLTPHQDDVMVEDDQHMDHHFHRAQDPPQHQPPPSFDQMTAPDPPTKAPTNTLSIQQQQQQQQQLEQQYHHQNYVDLQMGEQESAIASGIALPLKELEYDDRMDYAADVSVMDSLGGPSLLVERARHENAVSSGHDRASDANLERQDPELAELVAAHGRDFVPDPGMTREETAFRDPYKFYEHAVCALLKENEPEKVRLLSKLMAKYRGRERHLINKLSARYNKDKGHTERDVGGGGVSGGNEPAVAASGSADRSKASANDNNNNNNNNAANMASMSGMEKIHEGEDEEAGSSVLNDPSRANIAAINEAKKRVESGNEVGKSTSSSPKAASAVPAVDSIPKVKSSNDDGWPPAMSDPWGTGGGGGQAGGGPAANHRHNDDGIPKDVGREEEHRPMIMSDDGSGSYSDDGSSYSAESEGVDGTSPAIIAQVSELLNYVYGKTSVAGQIDRVSTIMRAYEGREAVLLELLETKALIKANADSNRDAGDLPVSLRNNAGLNNASSPKPPASSPGGGGAEGDGNSPNDGPNAGDAKKVMHPPSQTPVSNLTTPTMEYPAAQASPASVNSPQNATSPSAGTLNTVNTAASSKKKKKGIFGGFFGGKKKGKGGGGGNNFPSSGETIKTSSPGKVRSRRLGRKGQPLNEEDRSI